MNKIAGLLELARYHGGRREKPPVQEANITYREGSMNSVVAEVRSILEESMSARRRYAADLAHHSLDEYAFDRAVRAFDRVYAHAYRPACRGEEREAHNDAQLEALQTFLSVYLTEAGQQ